MVSKQTWKAFLTFASFCLVCGPAFARPYRLDADLLITVDPERQQFIDSLGRERFFHGTNIVVKEPPYHPKTTGHDHGTFSEEDMKFLQSLGLNSVRLGKLLDFWALCFCTLGRM